MNQWAFVIAAYALTALATGGLVVVSWLSMRRAEAEAEASRRRP
jgi:hypothetical protein